MLGVALALGEPVLPSVWWPLLAMAVLGQVVGQGLLVYALKHFSALVFGLSLLTQPAIAVALGWFAFGETLVWLDFAGIALVALGLALARSTQD